MKVKKRIASAVLGAAVLISSLPFAAAAAGFSDVPSNAWYKTAVNSLSEQKIISGTGGSKFSPEESLTRAAFVTMLAKTVLTEDELAQYKFKGSFTDVNEQNWANPYVNWASEVGVASGYEDNTFRPNQDVTRQEMAILVHNFARAYGREMNAVNQKGTFKDNKQIASYAAASVTACQQAGVISGYTDGSFRPNGSATRAEAAALYYNFLQKCPYGSLPIVRKRILNTAVRAVTFDPKDYSMNLVMGRDITDGAESATSIVNRSGATIAVNAAFFDMDSYLPVGTLVKEGRVVTVCDWNAPYMPSFTQMSDGTISIENFSTLHSVSRTKEDGTTQTLTQVGFNTWPTSKNDATRILFTRDWGKDLAFTAKDAITIDADGTVLAVDHDKNVSIPAGGYVLAQRAKNMNNSDFFDNVQVGDHLDITRTYEGATSQDITMSIGAGPRLLKNGEIYGSLSTYQQEGFKDPNITTYSARRVCLGIKANGELVLCTAYTTLATLSRIMLNLGCVEAINLDGGGSTNLYVDGEWVWGPQSRPLNNMLVFTEK